MNKTSEEMKKNIMELISNCQITPIEGDYMEYGEITDEQFEFELQYQLQRELTMKQIITNLKTN